ncbi:hypothetical protein EV670_0695 [Rivibacter subsaxonicus]|uniref:Uncharacterized protein n=2 Tax=Rivibacter subsaxonicus TaxID=457575 RepID=A0A4V2FUM9_9BURK|nr:hypothetical protein EV670_0695 [Rivibacter subsaxonicus]
MKKLRWSSRDCIQPRAMVGAWPACRKAWRGVSASRCERGLTAKQARATFDQGPSTTATIQTHTRMSRSTPARYALQLALGAGLAWCGNAAAENVADRYWMQVDAFFPRAESSAQADLLVGDVPGTEIDFERDLGLPRDSSLPYLRLGARAGEAWRFEFEYYALRRSGRRSIDKEIRWDDSVYPVSAVLDSRFDSDVYRATVGYSFLLQPNAEFGASLGVHATRFNIELAGAVSGSIVEAVHVEQQEEMFPLPTLGVYGIFALAPDWLLRGRADYLTLSIDDYSGSLINASASLNWRFSPRFGIGLGYRYVHYDIRVERQLWRGSVNYRFFGPTLYLEAAF